MFIGAEGTLGVVTKVAIHTPQRPRVYRIVVVCIDMCINIPLQSVNVAFLACPSFEQVRSVFLAARSVLGEIVSGRP